MAPGRIANQINTIRINTVVISMGVHPANRRLHILISSRSGRCTDQAIVNSHGEIAHTGPLGNLERFTVVALARSPATPMHINDRWKICAIDRVCNVGENCRAIGAAEDDVLLNRNRYLCNRTSRRYQRQPAKNN
jgi:hypothetical protein